MDYAHNDTSLGERKTSTAVFNRPKLSQQLQEIRRDAQSREIPVADDETLCFLATLLNAVKPKKILELGTAVGISALFMLENLPEAHVTTIEKNENFYAEAQKNFKNLVAEERIKLISGDAGEEIKKLNGEFDFIFLDSAKVQYIKYLPDLKRLLTKGGVLYADDVLLYGWVTGEAPKKRKMLVEHIREYIEAVTSDDELTTTIIDIGDGAAVSVKK